MLAGEGFFRVNRSQKSPFIIYVGNIVITAPPGTALNTKAYAEEQNVTISVSEGRVILSRNNHRLPTIAQGRTFIVNKILMDLLFKKKTPIENIAAWQNGDMLYEKERLADVLADLKRVYNVELYFLMQS